MKDRSDAIANRSILKCPPLQQERLRFQSIINGLLESVIPCRDGCGGRGSP